MFVISKVTGKPLNMSELQKLLTWRNNNVTQDKCKCDKTVSEQNNR
jgi:hypothetical protein